MAKATSRAIQHKPSSNGVIQWLLVKPWTSSIGQWAPHCTGAAMAIKTASNWCVFFLTFDFCCHTTIANNHVMVRNKLNQATILLFIMLIIYLCNIVAQRRWWMLFWPPLLMAGMWYVKSRVAVEINYLLHYFMDWNKTQQQHPQSTLQNGTINKNHTVRWANGSPWWECFVECVELIDGGVFYVGIVLESMEHNFMFLPEPLIAV